MHPVKTRVRRLHRNAIASLLHRAKPGMSGGTLHPDARPPESPGRQESVEKSMSEGLRLSIFQEYVPSNRHNTDNFARRQAARRKRIQGMGKLGNARRPNNEDIQ